MRTLRYLPLVALAGVDGFVMFVPYLLLVGAAAVVIGRVRSQPLQPVAVVASEYLR
ncbi:MAG: hypothetical protein WBD40_11530 [Tepidisphaeraceae bacterium]